MSARRSFVPLYALSLLLVPRVLAESAASQPANSVKVTSASPSSRPSSEGSVEEAMRRLWTVPRPRTAHEAATNPATRRTGKDLPYSRVLPGPDHDTASTMKPVNQPQTLARADGRRAPTQEQMNRAFPNRSFPRPDREMTGEPPAGWRGPGMGAPGVGATPWGYGPGGGYDTGVGGRYSFGFQGYPFGLDAYDARLGGRDFVKWYDYWNWYDESNARTDRILKNYSGHLAKALELFNKGAYVESADAFQLACDTHQGDPSARLYAAHALFAIGRYRDAIPFLHRAFELQPRVIFLGFDVRDDYGRKRDFDLHLAALEDALKQSPHNRDRLLLLGYMYYFSQQRDRAYPILREAYRLDHSDQLVIALLENSRPPDVMLETNSKP